MSRFIKKIGYHDFTLLVSIPRNHPDMAKAAEYGGADAIKVHLNVKHPASGHIFGSLKQERKGIEAILKKVSFPVGVVPGADKTATLAELDEMEKMGIDFFDIFAHDMPLPYLNSDLGKMVCIDGRYTPEQVKKLADLGVDVFEASVIPHDGYGKPAVLSDLARWKALTENLETPVMVSTQRKLLPEECRILAQVGVRGIVIGVVVTGETTKGVQQITKAFRIAIDEINRSRKLH